MKFNELPLDAAILKVFKKTKPIRTEISKHQKTLGELENQLEKLKSSIENNKSEILNIRTNLLASSGTGGFKVIQKADRIRFLESENVLFHNQISELTRRREQTAVMLEKLNKHLAELSVEKDRINEIISFEKKKMRELHEEIIMEEIAEFKSFEKLKS